MKAYDRVLISRKTTRPTALEFIEKIFDDFIEFHGDRSFGDDGAIVGGVCTLLGKPITAIGIQKGRNLDENIKRNFGSPHPEGYRKALRLMRQAEKFKRPVIVFINTSGAFPGVGAEERGQGEAIAVNLMEMSRLQVPIISVIIGEGCSGGALALAVADSVFMLENAVYSILSPEGFSSILWKDASRAAEAAELMKMTAADLLNLHVIEKIIKEPEGGLDNSADEKSVKNFNQTAEALKKELLSSLKYFLGLSTDTLLQKRYERFRKIGVFES